MHDERDTNRDQTEDSGRQQPISQDSAKGEFGGIDREEGEDQPDKPAGAEGEGFIGRETTEEPKIAPDGQGALEGEEEDVEGGQPRGERTDVERE